MVGEPSSYVTLQQRVKVWMQIVVSLLILLIGTVVLLAPNAILPHSVDEGTKRFAAGWIGMVVGYWLS